MATKDFIFLEGFAAGRGMNNLLRALNVSNLLHGDTLRKDGSLYITHPTAVTATAVRFGVYDETTLCVKQLHDVIEDCDVDEIDLVRKFGLPEEVATGVRLVSKDKAHPISMEAYMKQCLSRPSTALTKIGDRGHNISTMFDGFTLEKQREYIIETDYIIQLCRDARRLYPEYASYILEMKKNIYNICDITKSFLVKLEEKDQKIEELERIIGGIKS